MASVGLLFVTGTNHEYFSIKAKIVTGYGKAAPPFSIAGSRENTLDSFFREA